MLIPPIPPTPPPKKKKKKKKEEVYIVQKTANYVSQFHSIFYSVISERLLHK